MSSSVGKNYNWLMGADMYLATSIILCDEMLKSYISPIPSFNNIHQIDKRCGFTSLNPDYEMIIPIIFNLKHGIELYLKALTMKIRPDSKYSYSHDLIFLLNNLIKEIKIKDDDILSQTLDKKLRNIIKKYYFGMYIPPNKSTQPDVLNEAERYPSHRNINCYKIEKLHDINMFNLLNKTKKDCVDLQKLFREEIWKKIIIFKKYEQI